MHDCQKQHHLITSHLPLHDFSEHIKNVQKSVVFFFGFLLKVYHDKGFTDSSIFKSEWVYGCTDYDQQEPLLYCLRVYLDTVYPEPSPERLDPSLSPDSELYDEDCTIL